MKSSLKFYDVRAKKGFSTEKYREQIKSGRRFAVATSPSGGTAWRILPKK